MKKKELQVLVEELFERINLLENRHIKILNYFDATRHPHINEINDQLND